MRLKELIEGIQYLNFQGEDAEIKHLSYDSRNIKEGSLFFAIKGKNFDGNQFVEEAVEKGAVGVVSALPPARDDIAWLQVLDVREAMAGIADTFFGHPSRDLKVVGVTGTNGKTTVVQLFASIAGGGFISTVENFYGKKERSRLTTPESIDIQSMLSQMKNAGMKYASIEASSHGLYFHRLDNIDFDVAVFTNLSGDHLDFHLTMERYFQAKAKLFQMVEGPEKWAIINNDDPYGKRLLEMVTCGTLTYGMDSESSIYPEKFLITIEGIEADIHSPLGTFKITSSITGRFNLYNIMAAIGASIVLGIEKEKIVEGIRNFKGVKGRMERIRYGDVVVIIDYAHSDDSLRKLLKSVRELVKGRLIAVFGAGGDRDRSKRPRMGRVAGKLADLVIITSDNPRSEDPLKIIKEIEAGVMEETSLYMKIPDRKKAIKKALSLAKPGDAVVIAGKGHEDYQIFKDRVIHFSDHEVVEEVLQGEK